MVTGLVEGTQDHKETHMFFHQTGLIFGSSEMLGNISGVGERSLAYCSYKIYIYTSYSYILYMYIYICIIHIYILYISTLKMIL